MTDRPARVAARRRRATTATDRSAGPALHEVLAVGLGLQQRGAGPPPGPPATSGGRWTWSTAAWAAVWSPLALAAVVAGLALGDLSALVGWFCVGVVVSGLIARTLEDRRGTEHAAGAPGLDAPARVPVPAVAACGGLVALSVHVGHQLVGPPTYALAFSAAATSPLVITTLSSRRRRTHADPASGWAGATDAHLRRRWCETLDELAAARDAARVIAVAQTRSDLLDEIERRHPALVGGWLASGAPSCKPDSGQIPPVGGWSHRPARHPWL